MAKQKKPAAKKAKKTAAKKALKPVKKKTAGAAKKTTAKTLPRKKPAKNPKKKRKPETLMCFLTTACVNYYALPDDGYELTTLRQYRDTYLVAQPGGEDLIREYYAVSPGIVRLIEKDKDKKAVYAYIYEQVRSACSEIEKRHPARAKRVYMDLVKSLMNRYALN